MQPTERDQYNNINTKFCLQEGYTLFKVEGLNETVELYCASDKEAAKLFALYLDHKASLPKVEESGQGIKVQVCDTSMTCIYEVWRGRDKIYAEAVYYQSVSFHLHLKHSGVNHDMLI